MSNQQGKRWCFTIQFPLDTLSREITDFARGINWGVYGNCQCEISPTTQRPHIQGFVQFDSNHRLSAVKALHGTAHWEKAKGSLKDNEAYCTKEASRMPGTSPFVWGTRPSDSQGKRTDLDDAAALIRVTPGTIQQRMRAVALAYPSVYARFYKGLEALAEHLVEVTIPAPTREEFYPWQSNLHELLMQPPNDRTINYVYDPDGNNGKSAFIRYFLKTYPEESVVLDGKVADMSYGYKGQKYVFIDVPRSNADPVNGTKWTPDHLYHFAEKLKNGFFFSGKFASGHKTFSIPHVTFMSNCPPVDGLWTADRLNLITISDLFNHP